MLCYRLSSGDNIQTEPAGAKRKRPEMEFSTPINTRRETSLMEMCDDSPINKDSSTNSSTYSASDDVVQNVKVRAGMSNELDTMNVTPPAVMSPESFDKRLALHAAEIVKADSGNRRIPELQEQEVHTIEIAINTFAKRDGEPVKSSVLFAPDTSERAQHDSSVNGQRSGGMEGMNNGLIGSDEARGDALRSVGIDGMNKAAEGGGGLLVWME